MRGYLQGEVYGGYDEGEDVESKEENEENETG